MPFLAQSHIPIPTQDLLSWMFDNPQYDVDMPIYIDAANPQNSISNRQAKLMIRKMAAGFKKAGLQKGDVVCVHSFNDIYYPIAFLGIIAAGGIFAGTNPSYTPYEISHAIRTAQIKFFICEPEVMKNVLTASETCGIPKKNVFVFNSRGQSVPAGFESWTSLMSQGETDWERFNDKYTCESTPVARLFSSGTTGLPKALDTTHYNFIAQHTLVVEHRPRPYPLRRLVCNPLFHVSQAPRVHTSALRSGITTYIMRRFELEPWLKNVERYEITELNFVPMMVITVLSSGLATKSTFRSIRSASSGAAPLDKALQQRFQQYLADDVPFSQVWGMSETSCIATMFYYPEYDDTGSVGRFIPNCDAKLVDDNGNDVSRPGIRGELCVRGPIVIRGYFNNPKANQESWDEDGYFHTGDIGYCTEDLMFYIVDRKKELIKVRGFQVAPPELEAVLLEHPNIIDAAVIGVQRGSEESELPRAYVVLRSGTSASESEVRDFSSARLARFKNLDGGVQFVESIPKNASGKILKNQLREWAKKEMRARL
ncbi:AMP-binding enzyme [Eremomyces bilateralis CBS 781.70]|uniref:AMP-binding enzyme n=1 Tax=Eremomyces bilateralis CBS 781.70 TaxID=1392243 RepID=A0A6G1FUK1_9PEZI|nr:AMP-binding enzyme [Eremomyces bilateralis CBS 781.70]KAF1809386.1 AMP-binding enzyme [Eremomyces bilateralis CBS 781.70]